jgi:hypothetical protein
VAPNVKWKAYRSQLKPHAEDALSSNPLPLFYFSGKAAPLEVGPDEWIVEEIKGHRRNSTTGKMKFLVKWKDWDPSDLQWLKPGSGVPSTT